MDPTLESGAGEVRNIMVPKSHSGRRIDNFLAWFLNDIPKSRIYRMLRKGEVRVNGSRVQQGYRLIEGDQLRIPPVRLEAKSPAVPNRRLWKLLEDSVLYEDKDLFILNKPAGLAVHGGSGIRSGIIETLRTLRPDEPYLELAHRLDRDTSGCLVIAKDPLVLRELHDLFRQGAIEKRYIALVAGRWRGGRRVIEEGLQRNVERSGERVVRVQQEGKAALTEMAPLELFEIASLVEVTLRTGRTHQIRVHAAYIGHPVAGDEKYGDPAFNKRMRTYGLSQLFLHAKSLTFRLHRSKQGIHVEARLPDAPSAVLERLRADQLLF